MNTSTTGVTLAAAFVNDVLELFEGNSADTQALKEMSSGLDLSDPNNQVSMEVYNEMCDYIEKQIGPANTKKLGRKIGNTAFNAMVHFNIIGSNPTPEEAMKGLATVAGTMIQDPLKRGWEILSTSDTEIIMRRTQTFNSILQLGLLLEIINKTDVKFPSVDYSKSVADGDEFDEYRISWV